jgi:ribosomal protein S18 acetylase RimI-like enzyme
MCREQAAKEGTVVRIREARLSDLPQIVDFNCRLATESEDLSLDRDVVRRGVRRALTNPQLCRYFIAEDEGPTGPRAVGQTMVTYELSDWRDGLVFWIQSVYVAAEARGKGVFGQLYEHVKAFARAGDGRLLRLYVEQENTPAIAVYERLGMKRTGYHLYEASL